MKVSVRSFTMKVNEKNLVVVVVLFKSTQFFFFLKRKILTALQNNIHELTVVAK